jgi:hypothetical protein
MKKKIRKKRGFGLLEVIKDLQNYRKWATTIKAEAQNPDSKFNKFGLNHNYFYVLYFPVTLPQEDLALPDNIKRLRVVETLTPVHQYLDNDLGFADYVVPEFNQFFDDDNQPTLTYGIVYRFAFQRLSVGWMVSRALTLGLLTFALIKWPILSTLFGWIVGS